MADWVEGFLERSLVDGSIFIGPLYCIIFTLNNGITFIYTVDFGKKIGFIPGTFLDYRES